jgi:nucleoside-diphosphate-sugar epimerase
VQRTFVTGGSGFVGRALLVELHRRGVPAVALARSDAAAAVVTAAGATAIRGDLDDVAAMTDGMRGCDVVVHSAAYVRDHGPRDAYFRANVHGTDHVLTAARAAGVRRLVHVSTEAVLADGRPIVRADEDRPLPARPVGLYPLTKQLAEKAVLGAGGDLEVVVVRPRFIWGKGDTTLLPVLTRAVRAGRFRWVGGGRYLTSTCHVDNVVEGICCAAERGPPGGVYFLTDGEPVEFRTFVGDMLRAAGAQPGDKAVPRWVVAALARATWFMNEPPVTRTALALACHEVTVVDARARREIGYQGARTIAEGLAELRPIA